MTRLTGFILTPQGFVRGSLEHGDRIEAVEGQAVTEAQARDGSAPLLLPGFVDLHLHGGGGHDVMGGGDAAAHIARTHARHGTTAWLATTMTAPVAEIEDALRALAAYGASPAAALGAQVLGVHLEGPFISAERLGAQPNFTVRGSLQQVQALHALAPIRLVTLAPEEPGHIELIVALRAAGFIVQLGHSAASYEQGVAALQAGASGFTHLFNAMSALHQRAPGLVGAALAHAERAELIPDLLHVHPGAIRVALRAIPGLYCVTDSTAAAGMPDGEYRLGRQVVHKCQGGVRLADGTLAGSTLTMDQALRNLVSLGLPLAQASRRCSALPAAHLGLVDHGVLAAGAQANMVVLDSGLTVQTVYVGGRDIT
jgi:N-acetylglucosamine-6-phosphate deacetylase